MSTRGSFYNLSGTDPILDLKTAGPVLDAFGPVPGEIFFYAVFKREEVCVLQYLTQPFTILVHKASNI